MIRILSLCGAVALAAAPALAHPGHLLDTGAGHSHLIDVALLAGAALAATGWGLAVLTRRIAARA
jgi:hypothetical protein